MTRLPFENIYLIDFEFQELPGELPSPICAVGKNILTGEVRCWTNHKPHSPPVYTTGPRDLVVAYAAEAEGKCIRALNWPLPTNCLDLYAVFRCYQNTFGENSPSSLLCALDTFTLPGLGVLQKEQMRKLAIRGGPFSQEEMSALCRYCQTDVEALEQLLPKLCHVVDLRHALLMGRYSMNAVSAMQRAGIPMAPALCQIVDSKDAIRTQLISQVDKQFGVYSGTTFSHSKFRSFLDEHKISWPRTKTGMLCVDEQTFKERALVHPFLAPLAELRKTVTLFQSISPSIGSDGRNRTAIRPFASSTGRNQPSTSACVYAWPKWFRHLIRPREGRAVINLDFEQQEFLIAAALSGDRNMLDAYYSGDPYLGTAIRSGRVPSTATKSSHPRERALHKTASLAIQYQCTAHGLGHLVGGYSQARQLIEEHQAVYASYHRWSQDQIDRVMLGSSLTTPFGWTIRKRHSTPATAIRSRGIANWPVQAAGGDILRIAAIALVERGFCVIAPVHDALVLECDADIVDDVAEAAAGLMREASAVVLDGAVCRVEKKITLHTPNLMSSDAPEMFKRVMNLLN